MAQKFGGAFGTAAVLWLLAAFGFNTAEGAVQTESAIEGLRLLISYVPAGIAALSAIFIFFYPLTTKRMKEINSLLKEIRNK
jgi:GPH family glycoside/pentoside/hexuronide:cation symporter